MIKSLTTITAFMLLGLSGLFAHTYTLDDYYKKDKALHRHVNEIYDSLTDSARIGQLLITSAGRLGLSDEKIFPLVASGKVGTVIYLRDSLAAHARRTRQLDSIARANGRLPLIISMDAEPSLINGRIPGMKDTIMKTNTILTERANDSIAHLINSYLKQIGVTHNYAPVCDISNSNAIISNRSYGPNPDSVAMLARAYITASQKDGVATIAKHFPGHGMVVGDTHKQSVHIDGELKELSVYKPLIDAGVVSVMVGHMSILNNERYCTDSMPSSLSRNIVTDLLRDSLGFKGIIMTDALTNMKAVTIYENSGLMAIQAGNDMLCMPNDETRTISMILDAIKTDPYLDSQVERSVKRVIRLKICLGLL